MIYEQPTIYKQGLQPASKDGFLYVQQNGNWVKFSSIISSSWVEINDKIGHIYQPALGGRVSFLYNKHLSLIMVLAWIAYEQNITSDMSTIFEFNNDLPGSQDNKLFTGTCPAVTKSSTNVGGFGAVRIIPNNDSDVNIARKITYEKFQTDYQYILGVNYVLAVNSSLVDEFNAYLE